jgi:hypothetical protein
MIALLQRILEQMMLKEELWAKILVLQDRVNK